MRTPSEQWRRILAHRIGDTAGPSSWNASTRERGAPVRCRRSRVPCGPSIGRPKIGPRDHPAKKGADGGRARDAVRADAGWTERRVPGRGQRSDRRVGDATDGIRCRRDVGGTKARALLEQPVGVLPSHLVRSTRRRVVGLAPARGRSTRREHRRGHGRGDRRGRLAVTSPSWVSQSPMGSCSQRPIRSERLRWPS